MPDALKPHKQSDTSWLITNKHSELGLNVKQKSGKLRVLWFVNTPFTGSQIGTHIAGGRGGWLSNLAGLIRNDLDLHVAFVDPYGPAVTREQGVTTYAVRPRYWKGQLVIKSISNFSFIREFSTNQLIDIADTANPDLIHIHGTEKGFSELLACAHVRLPPILLSFQGIMQRVAESYPGGYDRAFLARFWHDKGGRLASLLPKRQLGGWSYARRQALRERRCLQYARFVDGRTQYDREVASLLAPEAQYFHIDRALREAFLREAWRVDQTSPEVIFCTMSDSLLKGFDVIARAASLLQVTRPKARWHIAGLSASSMVVGAARRKMGSRYPDRVLKLLGKLDASSLAKNLKTARVFVLPSYCENSPNALAEAQLIGVPSVASDVGGIASYVKNNYSGRLVAAGDALQLAAAVTSILDNSTYATKLSSRAKRAAKERHDPRMIRSQLLSTYEQILSA